MRFFTILDTETGDKHNALARDIDGAKRDMAMVAARGMPGRRGHVIEGTRYEVEGETFDVAYTMEALEGAQPSRAERRDWRKVSPQQAQDLPYKHREALARDYDKNINEGGEGYNPYRKG
jgi:hypothetical protein